MAVTVHTCVPAEVGEAATQVSSHLDFWKYIKIEKKEIYQRLGEVSQMETLNCEKNCIQVNKVAAMLDVSYGSAHHIINGILEFHKVGD
jgi:hypothetical protein